MGVFAIAFGWMEAATVVYLRATSPTVVSSAIGTQFPAGWTDRFGAFLLTFGAWDLTYYVVLRLISGWPDALTNRHILFLIPAPWIGPLWAPVMVATIFVAVGSYLYWAAQRSRPYTAAMASSCSPQPEGWFISFLVNWPDVLVSRPQDFRQWLYWLALTRGTSWFVYVERRQRRH
jgi:hypothetical protein